MGDAKQVTGRYVRLISVVSTLPEHLDKLLVGRPIEVFSDDFLAKKHILRLLDVITASTDHDMPELDDIREFSDELSEWDGVGFLHLATMESEIKVSSHEVFFKLDDM